MPYAMAADRVENMRVPRIAIVFFSATGATARLASALLAGAEAGGADATMLPIASEHIIAGRFANEAVMQCCDAADALAFGTPTYMGGPAAQFKAFADATSERWEGQRWASKIAAGFTVGACPNGDQGHTLAYLAIFAAQH
jgi:multimeric flavodoxin WrbA